jgi:hypothetical protein
MEEWLMELKRLVEWKLAGEMEGLREREPATVLLCLPQIPQDLIWARTREDDMNGE